MTKKQAIVLFAGLMSIPTICVVAAPSPATIGVWLVFLLMVTIVSTLAVKRPENEEQPRD